MDYLEVGELIVPFQIHQMIDSANIKKNATPNGVAFFLNYFETFNLNSLFIYLDKYINLCF
jgi:hypothetical protein